jgi:hypothetical protein
MDFLMDLALALDQQMALGLALVTVLEWVLVER